MLKFFIINDFNDINDAKIRHFSLDKGHFIAKSLSKLGNEVYFLTTKNDYDKNGIKYIFINNITNEFIDTVDYVLVVREPLIIDIINKIPVIKEKIAIPKQMRTRPKFIIKSDSPIWFRNKQFVSSIRQIFDLDKDKCNIGQWIGAHIDFICAQNEDMAKLALRYISSKSIIISNMSIANQHVDFNELSNPYDINHTYCVNNSMTLTNHRALWPLYYVENPEKRNEINIKKYIIVYTGRIKIDNGKIFFNMKNIMDILGDKYELHIFPGSFIIPLDNGLTATHSSKNSNSLELLRNEIYANTKNIIIHYPYEHRDKYKYLHYADCGIDFSDTRPNRTKPLAGHAKILEYCESGLPVVCEDNIHNLFLIRNGKNGIILPFMASDNEYAEAIKKIVTMPIDREFCRSTTTKNENWDKRTLELLDQLANIK
jgi:hypothetical protein